MHKFYKHVYVDTKTMRFCTECSVCRKWKVADKVPLLCRDKKKLEKLEHGKADLFRQRLFNHRKAAAVQHLARYFNQCCVCDGWVCDDCYDVDADDGLCKSCQTNKKFN